MRSTARGSRPTTSGAKSSTIPASPRGEPCESVISAQPTSPSSAVALRKIHGRQPASQKSVSRRATFIAPEHTTRCTTPSHLAASLHAMTGLRAFTRRVLVAAERLADRRLGAVVVFLAALGMYGFRSVSWPLVNGRDLDEYLSYYAQLGLRHPPLP